MKTADKYFFDVNGYLVVSDIVPPDLLALLNQAFDQCDGRIREAGRFLSQGADVFSGGHQRREFDEPFNWPQPWSGAFLRLLSLPRTLGMMIELLGDGFRYDTLKGTAMTAGTEGFTLHGGAGNPESLAYYRVHGDIIRNGLMNVAYALTDVHPGDGGFACLPGSHKANYPIPPEVAKLETGGEHIRAIPVRAGSAIVFTEALIHGTMPWRGERERRTIFARYSPGSLMFRECALPVGYAEFAASLTPLQRAIFEPPHYRDRPSIAALLAAGAPAGR